MLIHNVFIITAVTRHDFWFQFVFLCFFQFLVFPFIRFIPVFFCSSYTLVNTHCPYLHVSGLVHFFSCV